MITHPGIIVFVEVGVAGERSMAVAEVPHTVAFIREGEQEIPVTRVVAHVIADERIIKSYAEDGRLLSTTRQRRN